MSEPLSSSRQQPMEGFDTFVRHDDRNAENQDLSNRHTILVRRMRLLLPVAALCVIGVLITVAGHDAPLAPVPREQILPQTASHNELVKPKFQSEDSSNHAYTITADKATQNATDMNMVYLEKPVANMEMGDNSHLDINAHDGAYNQQSGSLNLRGQVEMRHGNGYELKTESMDIDVVKKIMSSTSAVNVYGPTANITATGMSADNNQKIVTFIGPATLILRPNKPVTQVKETERTKK